MGIKVFISWSGPASHEVAESLREWLKSVIQAVEPWMSTEDIAKGARWGSEVAQRLEECRVGIICLTPSNLTAPWVLFEAGALSKTLEHTSVCPYLFGIDPSDVVGPLAQFQATRANKEDTKRLVHAINSAQDEGALPEQAVEEAFEVWWPKLEERLKGIDLGEEEQKAIQRTERELVEEVLDTVRAMGRDMHNLRLSVATQSGMGRLFGEESTPISVESLLAVVEAYESLEDDQKAKTLEALRQRVAHGRDWAWLASRKSRLPFPWELKPPLADLEPPRMTEDKIREMISEFLEPETEEGG